MGAFIEPMFWLGAVGTVFSLLAFLFGDNSSKALAWTVGLGLWTSLLYGADGYVNGPAREALEAKRPVQKVIRVETRTRTVEKKVPVRVEVPAKTIVRVPTNYAIYKEQMKACTGENSIFGGNSDDNMYAKCHVMAMQIADRNAPTRAAATPPPSFASLVNACQGNFSVDDSGRPTDGREIRTERIKLCGAIAIKAIEAYKR